jgi:hypothetical protein
MSEERESWVTDPMQVASLISKWRGGAAQGWAYSVSHSQLLIRVQCEREPVDLFSLFLWFKGCSHVSFQTIWNSFDLNIEELAGKFGPEFVATDSDRLQVRFKYGPFACETSDFRKLHGI